MCQFNLTELAKSIVAYLSMFYALNIDYPKEFEIALTAMQFFIFQNNDTPLDILESVQAGWSAYKDYSA